MPLKLLGKSGVRVRIAVGNLRFKAGGGSGGHNGIKSFDAHVGSQNNGYYRVIRYLKKKGYFQDEIEQADPDEDQAQDELLPEIQPASVQSRIAMGERRGQRVRRLGQLEWSDLHSELSGNLCAHVSGFSPHAAVYCAPWERSKLVKLCRYIARPAIAEDRLAIRPNGDIVLKLKTKYSDGTSHQHPNTRKAIFRPNLKTAIPFRSRLRTHCPVRRHLSLSTHC